MPLIRYTPPPQTPERKIIQHPIIFKTGVVIIAAGATYLIIKRIEKEIKLNRQQKLIDTNVSGIDLGGIAANIHDAFYNNDWFGFTEDELRAMTELAKLGTRKDLVPQLSEIYRKQYDKILKADFIAYLDADQYNAIKFYFE